MRLLLTSLMLAVLPGLAAAAGPEATEVAKALAPGGRLRAAINLGNPVLAQRAAAGAPVAGVSVAIALEIGRRLALPVDLVVYEGAGMVTDAIAQGAWDVGFLAIDPVRARQIEFSPPYVLIEGVYAVPQTSRLRTLADVDASDVRIVVGRASAYDLYLTPRLKAATIVRAATSAEAIKLFRTDRLEVVAGVRQPLAAYVAANPDLRLIDGRFMAIEQAVAVPVGRAQAARYAAGLIEELKASGFIARALAESGQGAVQVAPATK